MSSGTLPLSSAMDLKGPMPPGPSGATVKLQVRLGSSTAGSPSDEPRFALPGPPSWTFGQRSLCDCSREWWEQGSNAAAAEALTSRDYVITLKRIEELRDEEDEEDRPSEYAYKRALDLLRQTAKELRLDFRRAHVCIGPDGGLRITWSSGAREVRLICGAGPTSKTYIYHESPGAHDVEYSVNAPALTRYLRWAFQEA